MRQIEPALRRQAAVETVRRTGEWRTVSMSLQAVADASAGVARLTALQRLADGAATGALPPGDGVVQRFKFVIPKKGRVRRIRAESDDYKVNKAKERLAKDADFLDVDLTEEGLPEEVRARAAEVQEVARGRADEERRRERAERHRRLYRRDRPDPRNVGKQMAAPRVVDVSGGLPQTASLDYRGMSVQNVANLQHGPAADADPVFTVQQPEGKATAVEHIVDDAEDSPYLSFERGGLAVSAGKYAPKPVDPVTNRPLGVAKRSSGFRKQEKSYSEESRRKHRDDKYIGYVGGIRANEHPSEDYSTPNKAAALPDEKARDLAVADREVLVRPGAKGIERQNVPFVAKVKRVSGDYYERHIGHQSRKKALGYYKAFDKDPDYFKMQIADEHTEDGLEFDVSPEYIRQDDSESEMSDIESMEFSESED